MTYRILDLFSGAGGAAEGYHRAGFEVVGVDISAQPHYPFEFIQWDALSILEEMFYTGTLNEPPYILDDFDAIHASPPCQAYSDLISCRPELVGTYPQLIEPTRKLLQQTGLPYVIENVESSPLIDPLVLCATEFADTTVEWNGQTYQLQRHRGFEANWALPERYPCDHVYKTFPVYGHGQPGNMPWFTGAPMAKFAREVMQTPWMTRDEYCEAIPPYYTEYIGGYLIKHLDSTSKRQAA